MTSYTKIGLEVLESIPQISKHWGRCGYVCNQASFNMNWEHGVNVLNKILGERFTTIFGPQHGFSGVEQDNMIETSHSTHRSGRKIYSLYSETREPTKEMLELVDTIIVDLQIVGCRIYTFKSTLAGCLRAAQKYGKKIVILDRPNPLGGKFVEGRCVEEDYKSFVGEFVMPMRHGLSLGEVGMFFNQSIGAEMEVINLEDWNPLLDWRGTKRPWIMTSPNLPTLEPVFVYPGTVIFEGCNVSEGRGTGLPFQLLGTPYCSNGEAVIKRFQDYWGKDETGVHLREAEFSPTSGKWMGKLCHGVQIHILNPEKIRTTQLGLSLMKSFWDLCGEKFAFQSPPYEYEYEKLPMKIILGGEQSIAALENYTKDDEYWNWGVRNFMDQAKSILIYERSQLQN